MRHTAEALKLFDAGEPARLQAWDEAHTNDMVNALVNVNLASVALVQFAFWLDTKDVNTLDSCRRVDIDFMRRMVKIYEADT